MNDSEDIKYQHFQNAAKAVLMGKLIAINVYIMKKKNFK